jgi:hypothetical protein
VRPPEDDSRTAAETGLLPGLQELVRNTTSVDDEDEWLAPTRLLALTVEVAAFEATL